MATTWRRIGRLAFRRRMAVVAVSTSPIMSVLGIPAVQLSIALVTWPFVARLGTAIACLIVLELILLVLVAALSPGLMVTADGTRVRIGRHEIAAEQLDRFQISPTANREPLVAVSIGQHDGRSTRLWLRGASGALLDHDELSVLTALIERSNIRPPTSTYDPYGRFARYNYPGALTKLEAIDLVQHANDADYRLPLSD